MEEQFQRIEILLGKETMKKIHSKKVAIFGLGGVGSYVAEALVRAGITKFILVDSDKIDITNLNRQIHATHETIGHYKVDEMQKRMTSINPNVQIKGIKEFVTEENIQEILSEEDIDYVVDAIDTVKSKIAIIETAKSKNIWTISSMGAANKLDPTKLEVTDIYKTKTCPLAKIIRKELRKRNIPNLKVVYSTEQPQKPQLPPQTTGKVLGSTSFVPSTAGLLIASQIIGDVSQ